MKRTDTLIFSEIGKTSWSSKASEELLAKLIWKLNKEGKKTIKHFIYPIFHILDNQLFYIFFLGNLKRNNDTNFLFSTSIKFLRDIIFILQVYFLTLFFKPKNVYFYNINKFQIILLRFFPFFCKNLNLIQADGFILNKYQISIFRNVIVFSELLKKKYLKYQNVKVFQSIPYIYIKKLNYKPNSNSKKNKTIVHCGSISEYNFSFEWLVYLIKFCKKNKNINIKITTSQSKLPYYFSKMIVDFPSNLLFMGRLENEELFNLLRESDFGLDLRESCDLEVSDFPSKIFTYLKFNLKIISTKSKSISKPLSDILIPVNKLSDINEIDNFKYISNLKEVLIYMEKNSLDKIISLIN